MSTSRIGPLALEEPIGGPRSTLYRAIHVEQKRAVAVRLFPVPFGASDAAKRKFVAEADQLKSLLHPNIVRCYGGAVVEDQAYLAYEFIEGQTLADLLDARGHLSWEQVVDIAGQICGALEHAHGQQIFHLALALQKILLTESGQVKVADFRVERQGGFNPPVRLTTLRVSYLSPEQATSNGVTTERTDIYVFGCLMYRMLVGVPPFVADDVKELARMHREVAATRVSTQALDCPVWLDRLVQQMMEKDPNKRPYTAAAVQLAIEETRANIGKRRGVAEHAVGGVSALRMGQNKEEARNLLRGRRKKKKRRPRRESSTPFYEQVWFLAGAIVLLIAIVIFFMIPPSEDKMFRRAEEMLATDKRPDIRRAIDSQLRPMLRRFPEGKHAERARSYIDDYEMDALQRRLELNIRLQREPKSDAEKQVIQILRFKLFGDQQRTLRGCQLALTQIDDSKENRTVRLLAQRMENEIEKQGEPTSSIEFLATKLNEADQSMVAENRVAARRIWNTIVSLYPESEFAEPVAKARERLELPSEEDQ
ncbi:MAG: serine/threonine-protein kinase [Pirellulaceae bacterium]